MRSLEYSTPEEISALQAQPWQIQILALNPSYVYWGNSEDYMSSGKGWNEPITIENISELFEQDDLNEVAHFYFETSRDTKPCVHCSQSGLNPKTHELSETWYNSDSYSPVQNPYRTNCTYNANAWCHKLTDVEVDALWNAGRFKHKFATKPTSDEVNQWSLSAPFGHDAINRSICVEARATHLGVYGLCEHCQGDGEIYTSDKASTSLQLWILHPRKGCSRGVLLENIQEEDLPAIFKYLKTAQQRSIDRFAKIPTIIIADEQVAI